MSDRTGVARASRRLAKRLGMKRLYGSLRAAVVDRRAPQRVWREGLPAEVEFWEGVLPERVATSAEYRARVDPEAPIRDPLLKMLIERIPEETVSIIDIGAGPLTAVGKTHPGKTLSITATDPLAAEYVRIMREAGIEPPVPPLECRGEDLLSRFRPGSFDIAYARNALDHCADPARVIANMLELVKEGRFVVLRHLRREAERNLYRGLHQWNFDIEDGELVISRARGEKVRVDRMLSSIATAACFEEGNWIVCVLTKEALRGAHPVAPRLSPAVRAAALGLHVDGVTAEVVTAMRAAGIRTVLLKGPSIASWLYREDGDRTYIDSDLLVAPGSYREAGDVLGGLGFRPRAYSLHRDSQAWLRRRDASYVDLHRSLINVLAHPEVVWRELSTDTDTLPVGGIEVEVLRIPARALHVALHAAQHGAVDFRRPLEDLARAVRVADEGDWREAAELARRIEALPAFAAGLRLDPDGARLAERLKLPEKRPPAVELRAGSNVPVAIALESLARERSLRARARVLLGALAPSPLYMRQWSATHMSGWPATLRRGRLGLGLAYVWRPIWILMRLPKAIAALRRARRAHSPAED